MKTAEESAEIIKICAAACDYAKAVTGMNFSAEYDAEKETATFANDERAYFVNMRMSSVTAAGFGDIVNQFFANVRRDYA